MNGKLIGILEEKKWRRGNIWNYNGWKFPILIKKCGFIETGSTMKSRTNKKGLI